MKNFKYYKNGCLALMMAASFALTGCGESSYVPITANESNTIDSNSNGEMGTVSKVVSVPREDFQLIISYSIVPPEGVSTDDFKWRVTNDKNLNIEVHTDGLPEGYRVWIDNVHIDTFIEATDPYFNGITQDTMDDRIHSALIMGFPISDTTYYSSTNLISGQDKDFIEGTFRAYCSDEEGYARGEINQHRYVDEDYLKKGVYANKIGLIYGLLIQGPNDIEPYGVDVSDEVHVFVYNRVEKYDSSKGVINVYEYDMNGGATLVESYQYDAPKSLTYTNNEDGE
ncbi:MAG: hypothetical protein K2G03_02115 [Bacilli bacterium]|nr:hypothetical protein [Bacilli bacterium]